jgi:arylsulfatase A-like enzyme
MKRRDFLKSTATITGGGLLAGYDSSAHGVGSRPVPGRQPNILFILVDELRYPTVFPGDIKTPGEFLGKFMPNVHKLWKRGVKFGNYHTAANACTPSRGVMITGLYSQQSWLITTILSTPYPPAPPAKQPVLNPLYPTFGKLLRDAGYQTPYVGKWHVSVPSADADALEKYGFDFKTYYDPSGDNLQGTYGDESRGYHNDAYSASQAVDWLTNDRPRKQPWCLTVSLVNPHDREFFPAGTEFRTCNDLFLKDPIANPNNLQQFIDYPGNGPVVDWDQNQLKSPPSYGYPAIPPNWENRDSIANNKPSTQTFIREFQQGVWGGVTDDPTQDNPLVIQYPNPNPLENLNLGVLKMPYSYWQRGLDSYTQVMQIVDGQIGRVLETLHSLPKDVVENTVIVFAADHGEYSGAHGFVQGKIGTVYEEAWHIPLIVVDPSERFTGDIPEIRKGLASSIDLSTLLVSIGNKGTRDWMNRNLAQMYGDRHDMISMLKSAKAQGRPYVLYATDEIAPDYYNFNSAPTHVLGLRTEDTKLGAYSKWFPITSRIISRSVELEFYDYSTSQGRLELANTAAGGSRAAAGYETLIRELIPEELQAPLPRGGLRAAQEASKLAHLLYRELIAHKPSGDWKTGDLRKVLGFGGSF